MKVYRYYIRRKHIPYIIGSTRGNKNDWVLYAYTNNPEVRDQFERARNMKRFRRLCSKMSKKEYRSFRNSSVEDELVMGEYLYFSHDIGKDGKRIPIYAWIAMTYAEQECLNAVIDGGFLSNEPIWICPAIFKDKYYKALKTLQYVAGYRYWVSEQVEGIRAFTKIITLMNEREEEIYGEVDNHAIPEADFDEVELVLSLFKSTF